MCIFKLGPSTSNPAILDHAGFNKGHALVAGDDPFDYLDQGEEANKRVIRAQSKPLFDLSKSVQTGKYLKHLKPKQKETFVTGCIQTRKSYALDEAKSRTSKRAVLTQNEVEVEISELLSSPSVLKVYS
ncbi:hypothetical protein PanWU01x14_103910 [Parasponia andersonii]|uniref:Uncharacterized protein n=1 Tax=Parasponia andersonii TaxID=3476 RepID=A0A2P5D1Q0_PARAD|nr:hypothetical protein PanWU01x14_103910 [Parasponia andersonii]